MHHSLKHPIGLSADPVAKTVEVKPFAGVIVSLPYMGVHVDDEALPYPTEELKLRNHAAKEIGEDAQRPREFRDPLEILIDKVDHLASLLHCTPAEAERILFSKL